VQFRGQTPRRETISYDADELGRYINAILKENELIGLRGIQSLNRARKKYLRVEWVKRNK
jgi:hypothetical protein